MKHGPISAGMPEISSTRKKLLVLVLLYLTATIMAHKIEIYVVTLDYNKNRNFAD